MALSITPLFILKSKDSPLQVATPHPWAWARELMHNIRPQSSTSLMMLSHVSNLHRITYEGPTIISFNKLQREA